MAFTPNQNFHPLCLALVLVVVLGHWASQVSSSRSLDGQKASSMTARHEQWMAQHGRVYKDATEKERRFQIFKENVERIESFKGNASSKNYLFTIGVNAFLDLTTEEFAATHTGYINGPFHTAQSMYCDSMMTTKFGYQNLTDVPPSIDWRTRGAVTPIKNQGQCGCCWAFSAVAAVEGLNQIKTGQLVSLSEQELVDCVENCRGCGGGRMDVAFNFIRQNQGITTEEVYPYRATDEGQCQAMALQSYSKVTIDGYECVTPNDEAALMRAVSQGPVSVAIEGSGFYFKHYQSGILNGGCGTHLDHAVTVVGYGSEEGKNYWLVKNSWGETWGENGYVRMLRDENVCGISMQPVYPI